MNKIKTLEKIFSEYEKNLFKINNYESLKSISSLYNDDNIEKVKIKVDIIKNILNSIPKEDSDFLISYYIDKKPKEEYYCSESTFYSRLRKIANNFMGFFTFD